MATDTNDILWTYITGERNLSEDEMRALAQKAKEVGRLDQLYARIEERVDFHRFAKDHFAINNEPERAEEQQEQLREAERDLAIVQYFRFSDPDPNALKK